MYLLEEQETERLRFRKLTWEDFDAWLPFYQEPKSTRYWEGIPKDPLVACKEQFSRTFERYKNNLGGMNALTCKRTGKLVGLCGLLIQTVDDRPELEIGYSILPEYWGQGYATEAATQCKNYAFKRAYSSSLISIIHVDNLPSKKVAKNNGMKIEKTTIYKGNPVEIFRITHKLG